MTTEQHWRVFQNPGFLVTALAERFADDMEKFRGEEEKQTGHSARFGYYFTY